MNVDLPVLGLGVVVLIGASAAARYLKRRMDATTGIEVVGWAMTLMIANTMQLVGVVVVLAGFFD